MQESDLIKDVHSICFKLLDKIPPELNADRQALVDIFDFSYMKANNAINPLHRMDLLSLSFWKMRYMINENAKKNGSPVLNRSPAFSNP